MLFERCTLSETLQRTPELRVHGDWQCVNVSTGTAWPTEPQPMRFEDRDVWVMPHTTDHHPGLALNRPGDMDADAAWSLLHRALSLLAWREDAGAMVAHMSGGDLPRMMGLDRESGIALRGPFDLFDLPRINDPRAGLALALIREGRGLNHPAYAFLSFFRVIEVAIPDGRHRGRWIAEVLDQLEGRPAEALAKLRETVDGDVGVHLRESGRHAIAHAGAGPIINPDDPRDARRLRAELPIMRGLAELAIERKLGIQTGHTIWREHLYELRGWKRVLGAALVAAVVAGEIPAHDAIIDLPELDVRLRRSEPFPPLEGMQPVRAEAAHGRLDLVYRSADGRVDIAFQLRFADERLGFDVDRGLGVRDDGSADAARVAKAIERFVRDYFCNGELQMWDAATGGLVSRRDAYIPLNRYMDDNAYQAAVAAWDAEIARREARPPVR